ncbi:MAG: hypothetical protein ACJ798_11395 [Phenylobacterium sp.]
MAGGWLIGVLVEAAGEPQPLLHYFAVGHEDQGKSEWTAVDCARDAGHIAASPVRGQEPVQAIRALTPAKMKTLGLAPGQVRALGWKHPRRWLSG